MYRVCICNEFACMFTLLNVSVNKLVQFKNQQYLEIEVLWTRKSHNSTFSFRVKNIINFHIKPKVFSFYCISRHECHSTRTNSKTFLEIKLKKDVRGEMISINLCTDICIKSLHVDIAL